MSVSKQEFEALINKGYTLAVDERHIPEERGVEWVYSKDLGVFAYFNFGA